jgi:hypothetical protein
MVRRWAMLLVLAVGLCGSAGPSYAWGGHGFGGFHGGFHRFGGPRIAIGIGPFWGPYWGWEPYWAPYAYPPVVAPAPVVVPPTAPAPSWYYCENPQGYYPYVQQCPGGWRAVPPVPAS